MALFAKQPVHCPACGALHDAIVGNGLSVDGLGLCCDDDCREALRTSNVRYTMGVKAPHDENPFREMIAARMEKQ